MKSLTHDDYLTTLKNTVWTCEETYINARTKIKHRCNKNHILALLPRQAQNYGCKQCRIINMRKPAEIYTLELTKTKWKNLEPYITARKKIWHQCNNGHKSLIPPRHAKDDVGCNFCNKPKNDKCTLYYIKFIIKDTIYYKIGITTQTLKKRFMADARHINKIIFEKELSSYEAYKQEQEILYKFKNYRVLNGNLLIGSGSTELFIKDVLELDDVRDS